MEALSLAATHGGAIVHTHHHHFYLSASPELLRESRTLVFVIVIGWITTTAVQAVWSSQRPGPSNP